MATKVFRHIDTAGKNIYFRIFNEAGQVYDFADEDFTTLAEATESYEDTVTEFTDEGGATNSAYGVTIDLSKLNSTFLEKDFVIYAYDNATPADADDPVSGGYEITVQAGKLGRRVIEPELAAAFTTTAGAEIKLSAFLSVDGDRYELPGTASCTITVREHGEGVDLYDVTDTANAQGRFELLKESPGYTADRLYNHSVAVTVDGVTFTKDFDIPNYA